MSKPRVRPIATDLVRNLVNLAEAYAAATGVKVSTVGRHTHGTSTFYSDLASGHASCTLRKYDDLIAWFEANWPEGHAMPSLTDPKHYPTKRKLHGTEAKGRTKGKSSEKGRTGKK